jgi:hypothetical protein
MLPRYEFRVETDGICEVPEEIDQDEVKRRITMLFNLTVHASINDQQRAFSVASLPRW